MAFRYILVHLDGSEPTGTDDTALAMKMADEDGQFWVIDTSDSTTLEPDGNSSGIEEEDPANWEDDSDSGDGADDGNHSAD